MLAVSSAFLKRIVLFSVIEITAFVGLAQAQQPSALDGAVLTKPEIPASVTGALRSLNESLSAGIDPADNVVVHLVQIFGAEAFDPELQDDSLAMLGIAQVSKTTPRFIYVEPFIRSISTPTNEKTASDVDFLMGEIRACGDRAWKADKHPTVNQFLTTNEAALNIVVNTSRLPHYYAPMLSEDENQRLLSASLAIERRLPFLAHVLAARAMLRFSEHDVAGAMNDLMACQRLAVLLAVGSPFDVSTSKSQIIDNITFRAMKAMLESGHLSGDEAKLMLAAMNDVPRFPYPDVSANKGERAILHQELELFRGENQTMRDFFEVNRDNEAPELDQIRVKDLPHAAALNRADEVQDGFVHALSLRDRRQQVEAFQKLDREYEEWMNTADAKTVEVLKTLDKDRDAVSRWMGETIAFSLRPWYWQRRLADDRVRIRRDMVTIGAALVAYQRDHGKYPAELAELAPGYLTGIPNDAHSDQPFVYEQSPEAGIRLVSWGGNQKNDAGQTYNDDLLLQLK